MIEINNKRLCESCFSEIESEPCPHCGFDKSEYAADPLVLPMGARLNDKIVIGRVMGKGGFGVTYLGYDLRMEKTIAVKEYYPNGIAYRSPAGTEVSVADTKSSETFEKGAEKFYTEAQMVAQFNGNPNIVSVYDYFRANNTVYLIMEYISGITLKNYIKKHGKLSDGQALFVMDKIAAALSITHSAGVLHRDISPDNIMICRDGKVKLIDFGAARQIMAESSSNLTVVMKPGYTPIEQYTKKGRQGAWTDIYSLGVSIYYALTEVIIDDPYARMDSDEEFSDNKHGINDVLWGILKKCTMINASDRYGSAIDLRKALKSVSAPIESEPIVLSSDDLKEDDKNDSPSKSPDTAALTEAPDNGKQEEKSEEVIEVFEDNEKSEAAAESPEIGGSADYADEKPDDKNKKPIIIGICAAVVAVVILIAVAVNASLGTKDIDTNEDIAANKEVHQIVTINNGIIEKAELEKFDGDIRVTLKTSAINSCSESCIKIVDNNGIVNVNAIAVRKEDWYQVNKPDGDFVFIIPHSTVSGIKDRVYFNIHHGFVINSVVLQEDRYDEVIEFDGDYPGDWQTVENVISRETLKKYDGDVRVTFDVEMGTFASDMIYANKDGTPDGKYDPDLLRPVSSLHPVDIYHNKLNVEAVNVVDRAINDPASKFMFEGNGRRKISFILTKSDIDGLDSEGLCLQMFNLVIKKAYIEKLPSENAEQR